MISIIICSNTPTKFAAIQSHYQRLFHTPEAAGEPYEIIGVHDAKSLCEGYNRGLLASHGDLVVFSHDDIELWTPHFVPRLKAHLNTFDAVGIAGTDKLIAPAWVRAGPPHIFGQVAHQVGNDPFILMLYGITKKIAPNIQAMDGLFLAFRRHVIESLRWDADTFDGFHLYDVDCTYRAHLAGYRLAVALDLPILHRSGGAHDAVWARYAQAFLKKHTLPPATPITQQLAAIQTPSEPEMRTIMQSILDAAH